MTQEEKARAYDEVLEKARQLCDCPTTKPFISDLQDIFPELKEGSEDEKIRKEIINFLELPHPQFVGKRDHEKWLAWLEKQGEPQDKGEISDGYHTFNELYYYRMLYNAAFFNMLPKEWVHKSKRHNDGEECFGGGWFIVMANLPTGQISNHYELKDWDLFQIPEKEVADKWDGHTPQEAADRLHKYLFEKQSEQKPNPYSGTSFEYNGHTWGMCARDNGVDILLDKQLFKHLEKQGEQKQEINNFDVLPGLYKCVHRMFDGTPDGRLLFEVGNVYRCLSKHDRAEFEVSYGHSVYLEDPVVCKHFIPFEKQGEHKPVFEMKTPEESLGIDSDTYNKIVDECIYGENKPADKVEPKFKPDDWVVYYRNDSSREVLQVYDIRDGRYYFTDNVHFSWSVKECDEKSHLWTIQDAKDGDVLANNTIVLIVDHLGTFEHRPIIYSWYFANSEKFYGMGTSIPDRWEVKGFTPATKEQCNLLFQKMKEAGYEWDAEKKELSKRVIDEGKSEMDYCFTKMMNGEKVSSAWSKEDEKMLVDAYVMLDWYKGNNWWTARHIKDWLKSLKDRVQPQITWKPSDEQMDELENEHLKSVPKY